MHVRVCGRVRVRVRVRVCARVRVRNHVRAHVRVYVCTRTCICMCARVRAWFVVCGLCVPEALLVERAHDRRLDFVMQFVRGRSQRR